MFMIHGYIPKQKKRKVPKSVLMRNEFWEKQILAISPKTNGIVPETVFQTMPSLKVTGSRELRILSLGSGFSEATEIKSQHLYRYKSQRYCDSATNRMLFQYLLIMKQKKYQV
jgi:hypothetical protein